MEKVKLTNVEIETILSGIKSIKDNKVKLDGIVTYYIIKNTKMLESQYTIFNDMRNSLIMEHGEEDESGNYVIPEDKVNGFFKELEPISNDITEFDINTISVENLEGTSMTLDEQLALYFMIK